MKTVILSSKQTKPKKDMKLGQNSSGGEGIIIRGRGLWNALITTDIVSIY